MAETVVDGFEPVEIQDQHGDVATPAEGLLETIEEQDPVGQASEGIVKGR